MRGLAATAAADRGRIPTQPSAATFYDSIPEVSQMFEAGSRSCLQDWLEAEREANEAREQLTRCIDDGEHGPDLQQALSRATEASDKAAKYFESLMESLSARHKTASRRPPLLTDWLKRRPT